MSAPTLVTPYHLVSSTVARIVDLGRGFRRFTFTGPAVHRLASGGYDQRVKLILPLPDRGFADLPTGGDWYLQWRALPDECRNPVRTYTVRALRPEAAEVDIDIALHGRTGPASRWATDAVVGDELYICGPNAEHGGPYGGVDFLPPAHTDQFLLAGDPTAVPAIAAILESLPPHARGVAVLEVEHASDGNALGRVPDGVQVRLVVREPGRHGSRLIPAVEVAAAELCGTGSCHDTPPSTDLEDVDVDAGLLWEAPRNDEDGPARDRTRLYAWLAGEAAVIKSLRRHLVSERGIDRKSVAFMGYWRQGRAEDGR
ncbi:siderophore-interacting protein [Nakamurella deserti]|uniref:siderophore-interacting protein n=1 Tax=Nakamurella deserti TaxID=2164074 RepID=UPI000DBE56C9|nr:siderophore-interacting protein [Nakamurella deserti]